MKWKIDNLFKHQFIRPKKFFRDCYRGCCGYDKKFYIVDGNVDGVEYKTITMHCSNPNCYEPEDDIYGDALPSYMIDFTLLQLLHEEHIRNYPRCSSDRGIESRLDYYKKLKSSVSKDPYFKYLKRVANRNILKKEKRR